MIEDEILPYQYAGAEFLARKERALLGDDPGLGKSCQAVMACDAVNAQRILVLGPANARINWCREFDRWSMYPRISKPMMSGDDRPSSTGISTASYDMATPLKKPLPDAKPAMKAMFKMRTAFIRSLLAEPWDAVILDEAHYLGNRKSARSRFVFTHLVPKSKYVFCLSGTPAGNNIAETWPMLHHLGYFPADYWTFVDKFCEGYDDGWQFKITGAKRSAMPEYRALMDKMMLRRRKSEVLKELPPIRFLDVTVEPGPVDAAVHFPAFDKWRPPLDETVEKARRTLAGVLDMVNDLSLSEGKAQALADALPGLEAPSETMRRYVGLQKVKGTAELIAHDLENGIDKIVVFAVHKHVISELRDALKKYKPLVYYGGTEKNERQKRIDSFQNDPAHRVFIGQIVACGTAVTLTAAAEVIVVEASWNPVVNAQAVMRVHRIGQGRPVRARFISLPDPVDARVQEVLRKKTRALALAGLSVE